MTSLFTANKALNLFFRQRRLPSFGRQNRQFAKLSYHEMVAEIEREALAKKNGLELGEFPTEMIRNFSIIAHIDHGKSTLADRLLEYTGTIPPNLNQPQYLDKLQVERQRGITVKAQTTSMIYNRHNNNDNNNNNSSSYLLNLIDTPGHVDFSYEVSRSLAACQGVLLLVDATQGIQAQTVANFYLASEANLAIIPIINKIDLPTADPDRVKEQLKNTFDLDPSEALLASAKTGEGLEHVFRAVLERIPPPPGNPDSPLRMLLFDSYFHQYKKVICFVAVIDGLLRKGSRISSASTSKRYEVSEVGIMHPEMKPTAVLLTGQVGYVICGMHTTEEARVGDTLYNKKRPVSPLPGFKPAKRMVFSGLYPAEETNLSELEHAIEKLTCNDSSVSVQIENSAALGRGFRCGFLGLLHMDVFHQRLEQEYGVHVHNTIPTVPYIFEFKDGIKVDMHMCTDRYKNKKLKAIWEPTVIAKIILPREYVGTIMSLCVQREGEQLDLSYITSKQVVLKYRLPLRQIVVDFYDILKGTTSGYAIFMYEEAEPRLSKLIKLDAFLNNEKIDVMATIVHKSQAQSTAVTMMDMLKKFINRDQDNSISIVDAFTTRAIAVQRVPAAPLDRKGLKKQVKPQTTVNIPKEAFLQRMKLPTTPTK